MRDGSEVRGVAHPDFWKRSKVREDVLSLIKQYPYNTFTYDDLYDYALAHGWKRSINTIERVLRALGQEGILGRIYTGGKVIFVKDPEILGELKNLREWYHDAQLHARFNELRKIIEYVKKKFNVSEKGAIEMLEAR